MGELAWHLAEGDAYMSYGIDAGRFAMDAKPPNIERPRTVEGLALGYERIHREAVARVHKLKPEDLDRSVAFFTGPMPIRDILWGMIISHGIHHRGQLTLMCRLRGARRPGCTGPTVRRWLPCVRVRALLKRPRRSKGRRNGRPIVLRRAHTLPVSVLRPRELAVRAL